MIAILAIMLLAQVDVDLKNESEAVFASARSVTADHKLAGIYGDVGYIDEITSIAITVDSRIAFERHGCTGLIEANVGTFEQDGECLQVEWHYPVQHPNRPTVSKQLLLVPWGQALFLVPKARMHRFCIDARENRTLVLEHYFARKPSEEMELVDRPAIPQIYSGLIDLPEIITSVIKVEKQVVSDLSDDSKQIAQTVRLNKGRLDQVYEGMALECKHSGAIYIVNKVEDHACEAKTEIPVPKKRASIRPARVGWEFRTH